MGVLEKPRRRSPGLPRRAFVAALAAGAPALAAAAPAPLVDLSIAARGGTVRLKVAVADTDLARAEGLRHRLALPADQGMLYDLGHERIASFWMKDCHLSLDLVFIAANGRVLNIEADTAPRSVAPIASPAPVLAVLEINGGQAAALGIRPGDRVAHGIFARG